MPILRPEMCWSIARRPSRTTADAQVCEIAIRPRARPMRLTPMASKAKRRVEGHGRQRRAKLDQGGHVQDPACHDCRAEQKHARSRGDENPFANVQ